MRDLTSQRAALHTQTRRLKLLFVLSVGIVRVCGYVAMVAGIKLMIIFMF